ncbi:MAG: hypothetical protein KF739_01035 [Cryobacterium sp.]|nr:hypothetical protein [Micrococcales bacterium]MBX3309002.1 hypothetical protein [Cryobacterium sp.]
MTLAIPVDVGLFAQSVSRVRTASATVPVTVYGTVRCIRTHRIRHNLDRAGIHYHYVDLDLNRNSRRELRMLAGDHFATPVIRLDHDWLIAPTISELQSALKKHPLDTTR